MAKKKKYIIWFIVIALVAGGFFFLRSKKPKTTYATQEVKRGTLTRTVSVTGKLFSGTQVDLSHRSGGELAAVYVEVGDKVEAGEKVAALNPESLRIQLRQAESDIQYQKETLAHMKDNRSTYSGEQRDAQRDLIDKAGAVRDGILVQLGDLVIHSPIDGTVVARNFEVGENVGANAAIITVARPELEELEIQSNVPESDIVDIQIGQKAKVSFDAFSSEEIFDAQVVSIDPASTVIQDVVYYRVKLKLEKPDPRLKIGMSEDVDILTASKEGVLMIPLRAVKTEGSEKFVEVLRDAENNVTEKIKITIGLEGDEGMVEVLSGNLKEGDKVITLVNAPK